MKNQKRQNQKTRRETSFSSIMPNGMRVVGVKANATLYRWGFPVRG